MNGFEIFVASAAALAVIFALVAAFSRDLMRATLAFSGLSMSSGLLLLGLQADYLSLLLLFCGLLSTVIAVGFGSVLFGDLKTTGQAGGVRVTWDGVVNGVVGAGISVLAFLALQKIGDLHLAAGTDVVSEPLRAVDLGRAISLRHGPAFEVLGVVLLAGVLGAGFLMRRPDAD